MQQISKVKAIKIFLLAFILFAAGTTNAQVGIGTPNPNASAQLDVNSTNKGFLPPRMTQTQRDAITSPAAGLVVFNTSINALEFYTGTGWSSLTTPSTTAVFLPTIVIGTQQWMVKNLDVAFYRNGDPIPQVTDLDTWSHLTTGAWCYYNNDSTLGTTYGKLYNWYAVTDPRGLAPTGWHIPSDQEWTTLETTLGGQEVAGGKMKEAGTLHWRSPNYKGNNNSGWAGLPGGYRHSTGAFGNDEIIGYWWSSSDTSNSYFDAGLYRLLWNTHDYVGHYYHFKQDGASVRCIRD